MATHIEMPKLSDTMTEGTVLRWLKNLGDEVEIGDEIAEIETDKATMAMEAFDEGTLSEILIEEGGKAAVGATLAILRDEGEADAAPEEEPSTEAPVPEMASGPPTHLEPVAIEAKGPELAPEPAPEATVEPATGPPSAPVARPTTSRRIKASPLARKMAQTNGVDLAGLTGSGPGGRIVRKDVVAAMGKADTIESTTKSGRVALATPVATPGPTLSLEAGDQRIELSSLRRITAERLLASKTTIPHFYLHTEADAAPLMEIRRQVNLQAEATHGNKYTVNDLILKAVIGALQAVPSVNATFQGDHILQFGEIGVAVAVAVEDGLVTPVVRNATTKSLLQISREVKDFAARAREGRLLPNEFDGGTITVSNLGAYGVEAFDAIINPPQAAIISVGSIVEKPVVAGGEIVPGLRLDLGLSCDHRVVDGAVGAEFLAQVRKLIEKPALMLV